MRRKARRGPASEHIARCLRRYVEDPVSGKVDRKRVTALASRMGHHPSTIYNWAANRRGASADDVVMLAGVLQMSTDQLLGYTAPPAIDAAALDERLRAAEDAVASVGQLLQRTKAALQVARAGLIEPATE